RRSINRLTRKRPDRSMLPRRCLVSCLLFLSSAAACGGTGPTALPGTIELTTQTVGPEADDAYLAAIDGGAPFSIGANETRSFETPAGSHSIRFAGLADNCRLGLRTV